MDAACRHFAARGYVALTMNYRLTNAAGAALAPANWTGLPSPLRAPGWQGGFNPLPAAVWPAVRDTKAAVRWLRGRAPALRLDARFVGAGGWSAGACTTVHLASGLEWDYTTELSGDEDPGAASLEKHLNQSSLVQAGVVWAGNSVATDAKDALDGLDRWALRGRALAPLALYRGELDQTMTPWAQAEIQAKYNASGARCDVFVAPGVGHSSLFPSGAIAAPGAGAPVPVLNHSFTWLSEALGLAVRM